MKNITKTKYNRVSLFFLIFFFALLISLIFQSFGFTKSEINYKEFGQDQRCKYSLNQIDIYDLEEANKKILIYKEFFTSFENFKNFECVNKVISIQDGWPEVRIKIGDDNLLFQVLKFFGFVVILFFLNSRKKIYKIISFFSFFIYNLLINFTFSSDFRNPEFPGFYTYEFIFLETIVIYFLYLYLNNYKYLNDLSKNILKIFYPKINIYLYSLIALFIGLINLKKYNNKGLPVIQEYLISYEFGFVRRGFLGSLFNALSDDIFKIAFIYIPIVIFFLHFIYTFLMLRIYNYSAKSPIDLFLIFSPLIIGYQIYTISGGPGNKEIFGLISILIIFHSSQIKNLRLNIFGAILLNLSFYIHEVNILFVVLMIYLIRNTKFFKIITFSTAVNLVFYLFNYVNFDNINYISTKLCTEYFTKFENMGCDKSYYLEQDFLSSIKMVNTTVFLDNKYFIVYGFYLFLGMIPFILNGFFVKNKMLTLLAFINVLPLFIIAIDWGRWLFVLLNLLTILYFNNNNLKIINFSNSNFVFIIIFGISYLILWRVPYCCVEDLNIIYLLRVNKFNITFFFPVIYFIYIFTSQLNNRKSI